MKKILIILLLVVAMMGVFSLIFVLKNQRNEQHGLGAIPASSKPNQQYYQDEEHGLEATPTSSKPNLQYYQDEEHGLEATPTSSKLNQQYCQDKNGNKLSYAEALEIAQKCKYETARVITFTQNYLCNESTGTFWVDLNINPENVGCSPACVVNLANKTAKINWRCTGAKK